MLSKAGLLNLSRCHFKFKIRLLRLYISAGHASVHFYHQINTTKILEFQDSNIAVYQTIDRRQISRPHLSFPVEPQFVDFPS